MGGTERRYPLRIRGYTLKLKRANQVSPYADLAFNVVRQYSPIVLTNLQTTTPNKPSGEKLQVTDPLERFVEVLNNADFLQV